MLFAGPETHRQDIPTQRVLHPGLGMVDQHAGVDTAESALALDQKCQIFAIWFRLNLQESGQALFIEEPRRERVGSCKAPDRLAGALRWPP